MKTFLIYSILFFILFLGFVSGSKFLLPGFESLNKTKNLNSHYNITKMQDEEEGGLECLTLSCLAGFIIGAMIVYLFQI